MFSRMRLNWNIVINILVCTLEYEYSGNTAEEIAKHVRPEF